MCGFGIDNGSQSKRPLSKTSPLSNSQNVPSVKTSPQSKRPPVKTSPRQNVPRVKTSPESKRPHLLSKHMPLENVCIGKNVNYFATTSITIVSSFLNCFWEKYQACYCSQMILTNRVAISWICMCVCVCVCV